MTKKKFVERTVRRSGRTLKFSVCTHDQKMFEFMHVWKRSAESLALSSDSLARVLPGERLRTRTQLAGHVGGASRVARGSEARRHAHQGDRWRAR